MPGRVCLLLLHALQCLHPHQLTDHACATAPSGRYVRPIEWGREKDGGRLWRPISTTVTGPAKIWYRLVTWQAILLTHQSIGSKTDGLSLALLPWQVYLPNNLWDGYEALRPLLGGSYSLQQQHQQDDPPGHRNVCLGIWIPSDDMPDTLDVVVHNCEPSPRVEHWRMPMMHLGCCPDFPDEMKKRWRYLVIILQFWMDHNATVHIRGRLVRPMSPLASVVKETANLVLLDGFQIHWKHIVEDMPWYQHWDYARLQPVSPQLTNCLEKGMLLFHNKTDKILKEQVADTMHWRITRLAPRLNINIPKLSNGPSKVNSTMRT